ncbi:MAG: hypothetical protein MJZ26_02885 [Fibrobacter sp.]|nr:hypothetical protein [Fibrobacter sp.]
MKQTVCYYGLALLMAATGASIVACGDNTNTAGSTLETENSVANNAVVVQYSNGKPAARMQVIVRPDDFVAGSGIRFNKDDYSKGFVNAKTNDSGLVIIDSLKAGSYVIEARNGEDMKGAIHFTLAEDDSAFSDTVVMTPAASVKGQVVLPAAAKTVSVGIVGLDYTVKTDTLGNFEFPSVPEGDLSVLAFVYSVQPYVDETGKIQNYDKYMPVGKHTVSLASDEAVEDVVIGTPRDTVNVSPTMFEDFEDSTYGWYTALSKHATGKLSADEAGMGRSGLAAHFEYTNDSLYNWALIGHAFSEMQDFSTMDSVVLWIRGSADADTQWVSIAFDVLVDSTSEYKSGKAWAHKSINGEWNRIVVVPSDFRDPETDTNGGNIGWEAVKDHVTNISIFGGGKGYDLWVDDIEIFGVKEFERP